MTNTELLEELIMKSGYKKSYIAKVIGLKSTFGLMKKVQNKTEFKASEIVKLCELLGITKLEDRNKIFFATELTNRQLQKGMSVILEDFEICESTFKQVRHGNAILCIHRPVLTDSELASRTETLSRALNRFGKEIERKMEDEKNIH